MGGHQIGHYVLILVKLLVHLFEFTAEGIVGIHVGLAHLGEHVI